jgi:hypothetical protein
MTTEEPEHPTQILMKEIVKGVERAAIEKESISLIFEVTGFNGDVGNVKVTIEPYDETKEDE